MTTQQVIKPITLVTLKDATAQEVFDQVVNHLRTQGERAYDDSPDVQACQYRVTKEDGTVLKCAAGCLISDYEYKEGMDTREGGSTWFDLIGAGLVPSAHKDLIADLQQVHDDGEEFWEEGFRVIAREHNLNYTAGH